MAKMGEKIVYSTLDRASLMLPISERNSDEYEPVGDMQSLS